MSLNWRINVDALPPGRRVWPGRVSVPMPKGAAGVEGFSVVDAGGRVFPAQPLVLTQWPDGSPRWVQLDFQATGGGAYTVHPTPAETQPELPVQVGREADDYSITVGRLQVVMAPRRGSPLRSITWQGRELIEQEWRFDVVDENGQVWPLANEVRNVAVEADGAHRFQLSWETSHLTANADDEMMAVRFRIEFLAGIEGFSLSYHFFHKKPHCPELRLQRIDAEFPLAIHKNGVVVQQSYSNLGLRRFARLSRAVTLHVDRTRFATHVKAADDLDDDFAYPPFLRGTELHTGSAVALEDDDVAVFFTLRDMEMLRPKTLTVEPGKLSAGIWPQVAGPLNLPQGRSARQVFSFLFSEPNTEQVEVELAHPASLRLEPATAWLAADDSAAAGPTWDQPRLLDEKAPGAAFFSHLLRTGTGRWDTVPEMFNYGDIPDAGYTVAYPSQGRTPGGGEFSFAATSMIAHGLFHNPQGIPPVWTNNEYDAIYCLALEALRTRDSGVLRKLTAAARHQIEVDFVHHSDYWQQHRATPQHSYNHVTLMSAIASHQWTQGLYYYYVMTGDPDVPDVVRGICEFNISYIENDDIAFAMFFNRELGWALVALVFGYELTGDARYLEYARKIIRKLEQDAGRTDFAEVEQRMSTSPGINATGIGGGFNVNTIPLGLKCYHQATGEPWAFDLLHEWVAYGMTNFNSKATGVKMTELFPETFCYVCEVTGETKWLAESLWQLRMFCHGFGSAGWVDGHDGPLDTKRYTRIYRGLAPLLAALSRAGLLEPFENELLYGRPSTQCGGVMLSAVQ
jgi:hypothetical protein